MPLLEISEEDRRRLGSHDARAVRETMYGIVRAALERSYRAANDASEMKETFRGQGERLVLHELEALLETAHKRPQEQFIPPIPPIP